MNVPQHNPMNTRTLSNMEETYGAGVAEPPGGLNYMDEQHVKYGHNLGNHEPYPIIGTDSMASIYQSDNMTPDEYSYFFNWQQSGGGNGGHKFKRYKPKGIDYKKYDPSLRDGSVLHDHDKSFDLTRMHGGVVQNKTRYDEAPVFLASG